MKKALFAVLAFTALDSHAHHGWAEYDRDKPITLTGEVAEFGYEHPHGLVKVATPEKTWLGVLAPPSRMSMRGLSRDSLKAGDRVTLEGYPSRISPDEMRAERIIIEGRTVDFR